MARDCYTVHHLPGSLQRAQVAHLAPDSETVMMVAGMGRWAGHDFRFILLSRGHALMSGKSLLSPCLSPCHVVTLNA